MKGPHLMVASFSPAKIGVRGHNQIIKWKAHLMVASFSLAKIGVRAHNQFIKWKAPSMVCHFLPSGRGCGWGYQILKCRVGGTPAGNVDSFCGFMALECFTSTWNEKSSRRPYVFNIFCLHFFNVVILHHFGDPFRRKCVQNVRKTSCGLHWAIASQSLRPAEPQSFL